MPDYKKIQDVIHEDGVWDLHPSQTQKIFLFLKKESKKKSILFLLSSAFIINGYQKLHQFDADQAPMIYFNSQPLSSKKDNSNQLFNITLEDAFFLAKSNSLFIRFSLGQFWHGPKNFALPEQSYYSPGVLRIGVDDNENGEQSVAILYHELGHAIYFNQKNNSTNLAMDAVYTPDEIANLFEQNHGEKAYATYLSEQISDTFAILATLRLGQLHPEYSQRCLNSINELIALRSFSSFDLSHAHSEHLINLLNDFKNKDLTLLNGEALFNLALQLNLNPDNHYVWSFENYSFNAFSGIVHYATPENTFAQKLQTATLGVIQTKGSSNNDKKMVMPTAQDQIVTTDLLIKKWVQLKQNEPSEVFFQQVLSPTTHILSFENDHRLISKFAFMWLGNFQMFEGKPVIQNSNQNLNTSNKQFFSDEKIEQLHKQWAVIAYYINVQYQVAYEKSPPFTYEQTLDTENNPALVWAACLYLAHLQPLTPTTFLEYEQMLMEKEKNPGVVKSKINHHL